MSEKHSHLHANTTTKKQSFGTHPRQSFMPNKASIDYEDSITTNDTYDAYDPKTQQRPASPPHQSGGAYYGPPAADPDLGHTTYTQGFTQHPNMATEDLHSAYRPYNPQDYVAYQPTPPPPPPGPPPNSAATPSGLPPPPTGGHRPDADHVSKSSSSSVNIICSLGRSNRMEIEVASGEVSPQIFQCTRCAVSNKFIGREGSHT